jgi:hypothetical protein
MSADGHFRAGDTRSLTSAWRRFLLSVLAWIVHFAPLTAGAQELLGLLVFPGDSTRTGIVGVGGTNVAFDPTTRRLYFEDAVSLFTADLQQRVISTAPLEVCCPVLQFAAGPSATSVPALDSRGLFILAAALLVVGWKVSNSTPV